MKRAYIAGKITGNENYRKQFLKAESTIRKVHGNIKICNPIFVRPFLGVENWLCYMIVAVLNVVKSTDIYLISNWDQSRGAKIERAIGKFLCKQFWLLNEKPLAGPSEIIKQENNNWYVFRSFRNNPVALKKVIPQIQKL